jgi:hypothetical protein
VNGALAALVAGALSSSVIWGCATRESTAPQPRPQSARDYEPDGGWANYRPTGKDVAKQRDVDPTSPLGAPIIPITPGSPSVSPTVH